MASSLLVLLDDIATVLDDVATMTKVAAKKTAGVLGDDLALNAQQVTGVKADRELPVVWAVGVGSLKNKAILVPAALAISAFAPWAITPLLMVGGAYLCFEGYEKLTGLGHSNAHPSVTGNAVAAWPEAAENAKVASAMLRMTPKYERIAFVASPAPEARKALARLTKRYGNVPLSKAEVIVALGGTAVEGLFGMTEVRITRLRGSWMNFHGTPVMPTFHPSYVLRAEDGPDQGRATKRQVWEDMLQVMDRLALPISEKQRGFFK